MMQPSPHALTLPLAGVLLAGLLAAASPAARAEDGGATLQRIVDTGTVRLGHRESSVPFSYYDNRQQVVGYAHDLALRVTEAIKAELRLPALTLKLVPVTSQNRIPLVQNGTVDLECGSTSYTPDRARQVAFSLPYFVVSTRLMTRRGSPVRDFPDLQGRRVVVTAGTTSERLLRTFNETRGARLQIITARDHGEAFHVLQDGQVEAFMMDDALLNGERAKARVPEDWVITGTPLSVEYYACMLRRNDPAFKAVVDRGLARLMQSGEALKIYQRWFQKPLPPRGLNLAWPPSDTLLALFKNPQELPR